MRWTFLNLRNPFWGYRIKYKIWSIQIQENNFLNWQFFSNCLFVEKSEVKDRLYSFSIIQRAIFKRNRMWSTLLRIRPLIIVNPVKVLSAPFSSSSILFSKHYSTIESVLSIEDVRWICTCLWKPLVIVAWKENIAHIDWIRRAHTFLATISEWKINWDEEKKKKHTQIIYEGTLPHWVVCCWCCCYFSFCFSNEGSIHVVFRYAIQLIDDFFFFLLSHLMHEISLVCYIFFRVGFVYNPKCVLFVMSLRCVFQIRLIFV